MSGRLKDNQIHDFLTFSSAKGETSSEIAGGVYVLRDKALLMFRMIRLILAGLGVTEKIP